MRAWATADVRRRRHPLSKAKRAMSKRHAMLRLRTRNRNGSAPVAGANAVAGRACVFAGPGAAGSSGHGDDAFSASLNSSTASQARATRTHDLFDGGRSSATPPPSSGSLPAIPAAAMAAAATAGPPSWQLLPSPQSRRAWLAAAAPEAGVSAETTRHDGMEVAGWSAGRFVHRSVGTAEHPIMVPRSLGQTSDDVIGGGIGDDWRASERQRGKQGNYWWLKHQEPEDTDCGVLRGGGPGSSETVIPDCPETRSRAHHPSGVSRIPGGWWYAEPAPERGRMSGHAKRWAMIGSAAVKHLVDHPPSRTLASLLRRREATQGRAGGPGAACEPSGADNWSIANLYDSIGTMCREHTWLVDV